MKNFLWLIFDDIRSQYTHATQQVQLSWRILPSLRNCPKSIKLLLISFSVCRGLIMAFIPHSVSDIKAMLATIGVDSIDRLFDEIPENLRAKGLDKKIVPPAITEMQAKREMAELAVKDAIQLNFIGAGAYEHHIPAAVWELVGRGEFMTAYTPYQAEASQGTLQVIYEYQTMMASLMGMDVSNASLYDGASALAEAILMSVRLNKTAKPVKVLIPSNVQPSFRNTLNALVNNHGIECIEIPYSASTGKIEIEELKKYDQDKVAALVIAQPNFFGTLEDVDAITDWAHEHNAMVIACVNPLAMTFLKEPGLWGKKGADIACGSGQSFGVPLASGGPYFGFMCCKQDYVRQMPGRIVGRTVDAENKPGFTLTLQAREQHIRRAKATSNICTNQGLLMTAATIHMSLLGPEGLKQVAKLSHARTMQLTQKLLTIPGVESVFANPYFHESVLRLPVDAKSALIEMANQGIQAGFALEDYYPELKNCILICATETKTEADLDLYQQTLVEVVQRLKKSDVAKDKAALV